MTRRRKDRWTSHLLQSDARTPWFGATIIHRARLSCSCVGWVGSSGIGPKRPARKSAKASSTSCWVFISHGPPKTTACCRAPGRVELRVDEDKAGRPMRQFRFLASLPNTRPAGALDGKRVGRPANARSVSSPPPTREPAAHRARPAQRAPSSGWSRWPSTRCAWPSSGSSRSLTLRGAGAAGEFVQVRRGGQARRARPARAGARHPPGRRRASAGSGSAGGARGAGSANRWPMRRAASRRLHCPARSRPPPTSVTAEALINVAKYAQLRAKRPTSFLLSSATACAWKSAMTAWAARTRSTGSGLRGMVTCGRRAGRGPGALFPARRRQHHHGQIPSRSARPHRPRLGRRRPIAPVAGTPPRRTRSRRRLPSRTRLPTSRRSRAPSSCRRRRRRTLRGAR